MPAGALKRASLPVPSADPLFPAEPASVVTAPAGVIIRIVWFPASATYRLVLLSTATAPGLLNRASLPVPSAEPLLPADPAIVVTTAAGVIFRIVWSAGNSGS